MTNASIQNLNKIKYLHILSNNSVLHESNLIEMINSNRFCNEQHDFIITSKAVYEKNSNYSNCYYDPNILRPNRLKMYFTKNCFIILHCLNISLTTLYAIDSDILKRIVWVVWGHDLYLLESENFLKNKIKKIRRKLIDRKVKLFAGIGIGFKYDSLQVSKLYPKVRIFNMPYLTGNYKDIIFEKNNFKDKKVMKIMIGHCGYKFLNHLEIINKLAKYKDNNIIVSFVLCYGDVYYSRLVKETAVNTFGLEKVEFIEKQMNYLEYSNYINSIDIAIFDNIHQSGLGNLYLLFYLEKKIFLNKNSIFCQACILEGIEVFLTQDLEILSYEEFIKKPNDVSLSLMKSFGMYYLDKSIAVQNWYNSLTLLERCDDGY